MLLQCFQNLGYSDISRAVTHHFSVYALLGADVEEVEENVVETPVADAGSSVVLLEESPAENDGNSGYLYWLTGIGIVLILGILIIRKQKMDEGL